MGVLTLSTNMVTLYPSAALMEGSFPTVRTVRMVVSFTTQVEPAYSTLFNPAPVAEADKPVDARGIISIPINHAIDRILIILSFLIILSLS